MNRIRWAWPLVVIALLLVVPWGLYRMRPHRTLELVLLDKTVPFPTRVEHRSLYWLFDFLKIDRADGEPYDADLDYLGSHPSGTPGRPPERTIDLTFERVAGADLLYLADTYGVYEADLASGEKMLAALEQSPRVYGGLQPAEVDAVERVLGEGRTVIAEFNTLASPTGQQARERMERLLGVRWTRWVGRYFPRLDDENDLPRWLRESWERESGERWEFTGAGYVLLQDDAHVEVLRVGREVKRKGLRLQRSRPIDPLLERAGDGVGYAYWFDLVEAGPRAEVLASFQWELTAHGEDRLRERGLPLRFPAVVRHRTPVGADGPLDGTAYYFSGDFADNPMPDPWFRFAGYLPLKRRVESLKLAPSVDEFYWRFYVPIMCALLAEIEPDDR